MAKGYWIAHVDVHNDDGYKPYAAANPGIFKKFGGRFVVRGGKFENPDRRLRRPAAVIFFAAFNGASHAQGLLDSADRCQQPGRLQGLHDGDAAGP
jgi:uncharacterized protein (DUF1330 family)